MKTVTESNVVDLVDHEELLLLFQDYVARCVRDSKPFSHIYQLYSDVHVIAVPIEKFFAHRLRTRSNRKRSSGKRANWQSAV